MFSVLCFVFIHSFLSFIPKYIFNIFSAPFAFTAPLTLGFALNSKYANQKTLKYWWWAVANIILKKVRATIAYLFLTGIQNAKVRERLLNKFSE